MLKGKRGLLVLKIGRLMTLFSSKLAQIMEGIFESLKLKSHANTSTRLVQIGQSFHMTGLFPHIQQSIPNSAPKFTMAVILASKTVRARYSFHLRLRLFFLVLMVVLSLSDEHFLVSSLLLHHFKSHPALFLKQTRIKVGLVHIFYITAWSCVSVHLSI